MKQINVKIKQQDYLPLVDRYGSQKDLVNAISLRLEQILTAERYLIRKRTPQDEMYATLTIPIDDFIYPLVNEFCLHRNLTQKQMFDKLIKKL